MAGSIHRKSILDRVLFNISVNDLHDGAESTLNKFADDTRLGGVPDKPGSCAAIQRGLNRMN